MLLFTTAIFSLPIVNIVLIVWLTWPVSEFSVANAGALGDSFGWLNSVFSGLAFVGVIWTLIHQREELKESRESSRIDRFETTFFQLISMLRRNLEDIRVPRPDGGNQIYGVDALSFYTKNSNDRLKKHSKWLTTPNGRLVYQSLLQKSTQLIPPQARYLGTLEAILELIDRDLSNLEEKTPYWKILSSQLTSAECKYILLLCLRGKTDDRLLELVTDANPILKKFESIGVSESQRALFERLCGISLAERKDRFTNAFEESKYRNIRAKARKELTKAN